MTGYVTPAEPLRALVSELVAAGVRDAVICPGSRSMPLALALRAHPGIRVLTHLDERAAAFLALGLAKAGRRPVAILGTSGTAVVNFAPAVVEASYGRVPLIVLTADRPPELRDRGAAQTIDQSHLYGRYAKWYMELPVPETGEAMTALVRDAVDRSVAIATEAPVGPVQLNLPFRASLLPDGALAPDPFVEATTRTAVIGGTRLPAERDVAAIAGRVEDSRRPVLVVGPLDRPDAAEAISRLARASGAPILADALANLRLGPHDRSHLVLRPEAVLRSERFVGSHAPDLVLRLGATPTSGAMLTLADGVPLIVIDETGWNDPTLSGGTMVRSDPLAFASALASHLEPADARDSTWLDAWLAAGQRADAAIRATLSGFDEPFEGAIFAELEGVLPDGSLVYVGSSMPVRDLDSFLVPGDATVRCLANRGVNGIDGVVSSALGAAAAGGGPVLLVVGDVSFLHDLNALVAARANGLSATIVVVDNDGGGIFSFLPQGQVVRPEIGLPDHYEELFGTPHGLDLLALGGLLGAETADLGPGRIGPVIAESMRRPGIRLLRLRTERARNVELHRRIADAAAAAI